jgi:ornithine carrier protein
MAENATLFLAYNEIQNVIHWAFAHHQHDLPLPLLALGAAGAGAVTSFVLSAPSTLPPHSESSFLLFWGFFSFCRTPIELVKCKMQVQMLMPGAIAAAASPTGRRHRPPGPIKIITHVVRTMGMRGLWLGQAGTLLRETGGGAAWFTTKEFVAGRLLAARVPTGSETGTRMGMHQPPPTLRAWESALSGACAGIAFNLVLFPADTIKSVIQTEEELRPRPPGAPRPTFLGMGRAIWAKAGFSGLYAGCGITVARAVPSSALIFLVYDGLKRTFPAESVYR